MSLVKKQYARGHYYMLDGRKADGVTTLISGGMPKPGLVAWSARSVAEYVADNPDDVEAMRGWDRQRMIDALKETPFRERDTAASRGTEVHALAERLVRGETVEPPEEIRGHVEACARFLDDWRVTPLAIEAPVGNRTWNYAGTVDLVAQLPDGRHLICDYKTSRSGIWGETGLQLAAYANAEFYLDQDGAEQPMANLGITGGLAVHLRADGYDAHDIRVDDAAFRNFLHVAWVARMARTLKDDVVSPALARPLWETTP